MLADLKDLPTRKTLRDATLRVRALPYVCTHDTQPPSGQVIQTDHSTSALLRVIKKRDSSAPIAKKGAEPKNNKRTLEDAGGGGEEDGRPAKKQNNTGAVATLPNSGPQRPMATFTSDELKAKTVPQLKELLKSRGLPVSGVKDELVRRLVDHQRAAKSKT